MRPVKFYIIAAAAILAQAVPTLVGEPQGLAPISDDPTPANGGHLWPAASPEHPDDPDSGPEILRLASRSDITRHAPLRSGNRLILSNGLLLKVVEVLPLFWSALPGVTSAIPTLPAVELPLERVAASVVEHSKHVSGIKLANTGFRALEFAWKWDDNQEILPNFTVLEWQAIIISLYQSMPGPQWEEIRAHFDYAGHGLQIVMKLIRG